MIAAMAVSVKILGLIMLFANGLSMLEEPPGGVFVAAKSDVKYKFLEEWKTWKVKHLKFYNNTHEELLRHLTWLSNMKYIELHNANSHIFGFTLAMNHLGDMVRKQTARI